MNIRSWITLGMLAVAAPLCASPYPRFGASLSVPIVTKDPQYLRGYRAAVWYQPEALIWEHTHIFFDAAFGHWWVTNPTPNKSLNIYSVAPTLRYYITKTRYFAPFFDLSVGLSYLTQTKINTQNLGIHFAFQDQIGMGASFGAKEQLTIRLSALHYSNGSISKHNAGITIPIVLGAEYGFA